MNHYLNHSEKVSDILEQFGIEGYGAYWMINETIFSSPGKSLPFRSLILELPKVEKRLIERILNDFTHFFEIDGRWYSSLDYNDSKTVDKAYTEFSKAGIGGRWFSKVMQAKGIREDQLMEEFEKWKKHHESTVFNDLKHMKNAFNFWVQKAEVKKSKVSDESGWEGVK